MYHASIPAQSNFIYKIKIKIVLYVYDRSWIHEGTTIENCYAWNT